MVIQKRKEEKSIGIAAAKRVYMLKPRASTGKELVFYSVHTHMGKHSPTIPVFLNQKAFENLKKAKTEEIASGNTSWVVPRVSRPRRRPFNKVLAGRRTPRTTT